MKATCEDCRVDVKAIGEIYMLLDEIWKATGIHNLGGFLCIGCVENRLGRRLEPQDFSTCVLNAGWPPGLTNSKRLKERMGGRFETPPLTWRDLSLYPRQTTEAMRNWLKTHK